MTTILVAIGIPLYFLGFVFTARWVAEEIQESDGGIDDYDMLMSMVCGLVWPLYWVTIGLFTGIKKV